MRRRTWRSEKTVGGEEWEGESERVKITKRRFGEKGQGEERRLKAAAAVAAAATLGSKSQIEKSDESNGM